MLNKILFIPIICLVLFSCKISDRTDTEKIIADFERANQIDRRETVFSVAVEFRKGDLIFKGETDNIDLKNKFLNSIKSTNYTDAIILLPDSTVGDYKFGLINLSVANLRSEPKYSAELVSQALLGTPVKILKKKGGWYQVQTPDRYISWSDASSLVPITMSELTTWKTSKRILCTVDYVAVYQTNKLENPLSDIAMGNILNEKGRGVWTIEVQLPDGRSGFVRKADWIDFDRFKNTVEPDTTQLKESAKLLTGRPYLWGGTSVRAMDCSGFVKSLYFMNGIILARDASLQTKYGIQLSTETDFSQLQTGDLLFFGYPADAEQKEQVTHVAMSLGKTEFIHASGRIKENSLNPSSNIYSEFRKNSFIRARRVIGSTDNIGIQQLKNHPWY